MSDPVLMVTIAMCARSVVPLAAALTQWIALRARIELARIAAAAPPGTEIVEQNPQGGRWRFRSPRQPGEA